MKRKFFTNLILLLTVNVLVKPFWLFGIDRTVQVITGSVDYGLYYSLLSLSLTMNVLLDMGITNYNNRNIARYHHLLPKHMGNILGIKFMLAIVYAIICISMGFIFGYNKVQFHLLYFLIFNQFLLQLILYLRSNLSALHLFTTDSFVSVLDRIFMIFFCGILLFTNITGGVFKIEWFVYIQTLSYAIAALIIYLIVLKKAGKIKIAFNLNFSIVFLKKTFPYAILILLMSFYNRFDTVLIEWLLPENGMQQVGLYAHGFRLLDAVSMFGVLFSGMLLPIFSRMIKTRQSVGEMVVFAFSLIIFLSLTLSFSSFFYQEEIMGWLYKENIAESAPIFATLMFGFIPISTTYIFGTLLTANGSIRELNIMAAIGMVLNIVLNLILIPKLQAQGAAFVSLFTQSVTALAQVIIAVRIFHFKPQMGMILKVMLFAILIVVLGFFSKYIDNRLIGYLALLAASSLVAFAVGLIDLKSLINMVLNREE
ncbi:MAG TPA: polysaccharide biosynthesis C-terminal domain-containing protein [Prolixibacteraceae bacterium]|nr:polysaccharide biosynthesis C-terminal domain-containing protein [Prolixibacteraceae bacterium]HPS11685.1 polysaccharide biosynthesis C-terminal domain-containing protein [Prolixibacteraceae bacterium]